MQKQGSTSLVCICNSSPIAKSLSELPLVGPSPSERTEAKEIEAGDVSIVDADRRWYRFLQPGEARELFG
jgi:hypothetical protein